MRNWGTSQGVKGFLLGTESHVPALLGVDMAREGWPSGGFPRSCESVLQAGEQEGECAPHVFAVGGRLVSCGGTAGQLWGAGVWGSYVFCSPFSLAPQCGCQSSLSDRKRDLHEPPAAGSEWVLPPTLDSVKFWKPRPTRSPLKDASQLCVGREQRGCSPGHTSGRPRGAVGRRGSTSQREGA